MLFFLCLLLASSDVVSFHPRFFATSVAARAQLHVFDMPALSAELSPDSKYGNYNYSNYFKDMQDVDEKDANWEYVNPLETYPASAADDEILEELRLSKQLNNDVWQSTSMRDTQGGKFLGSYEVLAPRQLNGQFGLERLDVGSCTSEMSASTFDATYGVSINFRETYDSSSGKQMSDQEPAAPILASLLRETRQTFLPAEFRTAQGNQCVGGAFTLVRVEQEPLSPPATSSLDAPRQYVAEVGLIEGLLRVRVRFAFQAVRPQAPSQVLSREESERFHLELLGMVVIKEARPDASPFDLQPLLKNEPGVALYDPQAWGEPYVEIKLAPRLTILYPRGIAVDSPTVLTIQWEGPSGMRYQVDRKFENLIGSIKTLELTEIRTQDAESFPPSYQPVDLLK